jgi:hypothetical protein
MNDIEMEQKAIALLDKFIYEHGEDLKPIAHWGDGYCGYIAEKFRAHFGLNPNILHIKKKEKISSALRARTFMRDSFKCKKCGSSDDLTVDHIHPESKGGKATDDNLQTLCRSCNSKKGTKNV